MIIHQNIDLIMNQARDAGLNVDKNGFSDGYFAEISKPSNFRNNVSVMQKPVSGSISDEETAKVCQEVIDRIKNLGIIDSENLNIVVKMYVSFPSGEGGTVERIFTLDEKIEDWKRIMSDHIDLKYKYHGVSHMSLFGIEITCRYELHIS